MASHCSGSAVGHTSGTATGPVSSLSSSHSIQTSPNPLLPADTLLCLRCPFMLATFNVQTLMHASQQGYLAPTLETLAINFISNERVIKTPSPLSDQHPHLFPPWIFICVFLETPRLRILVLPELMWLLIGAEAALIDWIPVNSWLCVLKH